MSLGSLFSMLGGTLFSIVASRYLSKHDYATFRQTFLAYDLIAPFLLLGLPSTLYFYLPRTQIDKRGVLIDNTFLLLLLGFLYSLFLILGGNNLFAYRFSNPQLEQTLLWIAAYPLFMFPVAGMNSILVIAQKVNLLSIFNAILSLLITCLSIMAVISTHSFQIPILIRVSIAAIALPISLYFMYSSIPGKFRMPNIASLIKMIQFSAPIGMAAMFGTLTMQLHAFIVSLLCTPEKFAIYINGAFELPFISIVTGSITSVIISDMSNACASGNKADALMIFRNASVKSACILIPAMVFFSISAEPLIILIYTEKYRQSIAPFLIYLFVLPARIVYYGAAMMSLGMSREILFRSVIDLLINFILCFLFVRYFGYIGAAIGFILSLYIWTIPYNIHKISKGFGVSWKKLLPWSDLARIAVVSLISTPIPLLLLFACGDKFYLFRLIISFFSFSLICGYVLFYLGLIELPFTSKRLLLLIKKQK